MSRPSEWAPTLRRVVLQSGMQAFHDKHEPSMCGPGKWDTCGTLYRWAIRQIWAAGRNVLPDTGYRHDQKPHSQNREAFWYYCTFDLNWPPLNWGSFVLSFCPYNCLRFLILSHSSPSELWDRIKNGVNCMGRSQEQSSLNSEVGRWESCGYFYLRVLKF